MRCQRGQASVEWVGLVLFVGLALAAVVAVAPRVDGRSFGAFLAHRVLCIAQGGCDDGDAELAAAYGEDDATLVRRYAPNVVYEPGTYTLPVDFRECREHRCSDAPDDPALDAHTAARGGARATSFTRLHRVGGVTYLQYWFYYPDSTTTVGNAAGLYRTVTGRQPLGHHRDDWESYQVRIDAHEQASVRASSHHDYQGCKLWQCKNRWVPWTGWTRVSRGSHAGHVPMQIDRGPITPGPSGEAIVTRARPGRALLPGLDLRERTSTSTALRLVPLETLDIGGYRRLAPGISPPWEKQVSRDPESTSTS